MISADDNYITYLLTGIIAAISLYALANKKLFHRLIFHPASVLHKKEYYRLLSSALVHNNILHLVINLLMLYVLCSGLEESVPGPGRWILVLIIVNSLIVGNLLSLIIYRRDITYSCAGASGVAIGCLCSYLIFHPFENHLSIPMAGDIPNIYAAGGYLALMLIYSRKFNGGKVDYGVHVGGGLGGSLTSVLMNPAVITNIL